MALNHRLIMLIYFLFSLFICTPILRDYLSITLVLLIALWAILQIILNSGRIKRSSTVAVLILWCLYMLTYRLLGISTATFNNTVLNIMIFSLIYIGIKIKELSIVDRKRIAYSSIFIILVNILDNIRLEFLYPGCSEYINFSFGEKYLSMNVGGTPFIRLVVLFGIFSLIMLLYSTNKKLWFVSLLISAIYLAVSERMTALIIFCGFVIWILLNKILNHVGHRFKIVIIFGGIVVAFFAVFLIAPSFLEWLTTIIKSERINNRLLELAQILSFENVNDFTKVSSGQARLDLATQSIRTFFDGIRNFMIGVGDPGADANNAIKAGIGGHAELIDVLPKFGIIGTSILVVLLSKVRKCFFYGKSRLNVIFVVFIVMGFTGRIFLLAVYLFLFTVVPYFYDEAKGDFVV